MPVKKTTAKKATAKKPVEKKVNVASVAETKKTVVVETKKTDRCDCGCGWNCQCNEKCDCGKRFGLILKWVILVLLAWNVALSCFFLCKKSAYSLETLKYGWEANMQNVVNNLYKNDNYIKAQRQEIDSVLEQLWIN